MFHFPISVFRFLIQYFFRWLEQFCPDDSMSGYRRRGGRKYSDKEEVKLVRSIADKNAYERMNQSELWKALEEEKVLENRTARGMHSHFERDILPNIKTGKKSYGLTEKELSLFKKWGRKKKDVVEEEMEDGGELAQEDVLAPVEERHGELRGEP